MKEREKREKENRELLGWYLCHAIFSHLYGYKKVYCSQILA